MPLRPAMCLYALTIVASCLAASQVLTTGNALDVRIEGQQPVLETSGGPSVQGTITISPHPVRPVCDRLVFYVDDQVRLATDAPDPRLLLDTTSLRDGEHALRIEAERGGELCISTGSIRFLVANKSGSAVKDAFMQIPEKPSPPFEKLYRTWVTDEAIWFRGEEGDLERHGFTASRRMYITLTDLLRHIGGQLIWGPQSQYIEVHRNDITLRIMPGSRVVKVNNNPVDIGTPVVVRKGRTYVPARAICNLFGVYIEWNKAEQRAYIYAPQPSYAVERREYPWISAVTREPLGPAPGQVSFRNNSGLPVHVRFQGNGFMADWQIRAHSTLSPVYIAPGTYRVTVWSRQGADYETYVTVAAGVSDTYDIGVHEITLHSH